MLKNLSTTYDCKSAGTPGGLFFTKDTNNPTMMDEFFQKVPSLRDYCTLIKGLKNIKYIVLFKKTL